MKKKLKVEKKKRDVKSKNGESKKYKEREKCAKEVF
jgi:hypothetical protein